MLDRITELLSKYGVFELRIIGQIVKVRVPTKCKKAELIGCIYSVLTGAEPPYVPKKTGRPSLPVNDAPYREIVNQIKALLNESGGGFIFQTVRQESGQESKQENKIGGSKTGGNIVVYHVSKIKKYLKTDDDIEVVSSVIGALKKIRAQE